MKLSVSSSLGSDSHPPKNVTGNPSFPAMSCQIQRGSAVECRKYCWITSSFRNSARYGVISVTLLPYPADTCCLSPPPPSPVIHVVGVLQGYCMASFLKLQHKVRFSCIIGCRGCRKCGSPTGLTHGMLIEEVLQVKSIIPLAVICLSIH